jgi:hypothetical protein
MKCMLRRLLLLLVVFAPLPAHAQLDASYSGLWFNTAQSGHGLEVTLLSPTSATVTWFVYDGQGNPVHLGGVGEVSGSTITVPAFISRGMRFGSFQTADNRTEAWGTLVVSFASCSAAQLQWTSNYTLNGFNFGNGSMPLSRLTTVSTLPCGRRAGSGIYSGVMRATTGNASFTVTGIFDELGRAVLIADDGTAVYQGQYTTTASGTLAIQGNTQAAIGFQFPNGQTRLDFNGSGPFRDGDFINGTFTTPVLTGNYTLITDARYRRGASLDRLTGRYVGTVRNNLTVTLNVSAAGAITGSDTGGCQYNGTTTVPNPLYNAYSVEVVITGCSPNNGTYRGPMVLGDAQNFGDGRLMLVGASGPSLALVLIVGRQ